MSMTSVEVFKTEDERWAVQSDAAGSRRITYPSRGAAIAAGAHMARAEDAVLMIHGIDAPLSERDFSECEC